jgi:hypothetical protein
MKLTRLTDKLTTKRANTSRFHLWFAVGSLCSVLSSALAAVEPPALTAEFLTTLRSGDVRKLRDALDRGGGSRWFAGG